MSSVLRFFSEDFDFPDIPVRSFGPEDMKVVIELIRPLIPNIVHEGSRTVLLRFIDVFESEDVTTEVWLRRASVIQLHRLTCLAMSNLCKQFDEKYSNATPSKAFLYMVPPKLVSDIEVLAGFIREFSVFVGSTMNAVVTKAEKPKSWTN